MTAGACHISCQSGKWQGFVSRGDKLTQKGLSLRPNCKDHVQHQRRAETQRAVFIMPWLFGMTGLEAAQAVADLCTFLTSLPFAVGIIRELGAKAQKCL